MMQLTLSLNGENVVFPQQSQTGVDLSRSNRRSMEKKKPADTQLWQSSQEISYSARACKWGPGSLERYCHTALKP